MYQLPGSCIRVAMVPAGTSSHSIEFLNAGKTDEAHEAVMVAPPRYWPEPAWT